MILANCRCHTALLAFSMPNEASLDHNWHSWKIRGQTCFPIIFNCQTFCTNKCCCTLRNRRAQAGCAVFPFMTSFEAIRAWGRVVAELLLSVADLKSPSAQTAGLIVKLPSSLWFGLSRKAAASNVTDLALCRRMCTEIGGHILYALNTHADKERFSHLTGISAQLQRHR